MTLNTAYAEIRISSNLKGGTRQFGWLQAPATTEIDRLDQPQAVEDFRSLHGACGSIEALPASRPPRGPLMCAVPSAPGVAGVRVWGFMSLTL